MRCFYVPCFVRLKKKKKTHGIDIVNKIEFVDYRKQLKEGK